MIYRGIQSERGKIIHEACALDYALYRMGLQRRDDRVIDPDVARMIVEWYFSGNWRKEEENGREIDI